MEKFTTNSTAYFNRIIDELSEFDNLVQDEILFQYTEVGQLKQHGFSFCYIENHPNIVFKKWNAAYDNSRFKYGIYNLDRLNIATLNLKVLEPQKENFNSIDFSKLKVNPYKGIILDGFYCALNLPRINTSFAWNINKEMNPELFTLIIALRKIALDQ